MGTPSPLDIFLFIPVSGDGRHLGSRIGRQLLEFHDFKQIAETAADSAAEWAT